MNTKINNGGKQQPYDLNGKYIGSGESKKIEKDLKEAPKDKAMDYGVQKPIFNNQSKNENTSENKESIIDFLIDDEFEAIEGYKSAIGKINDEEITNKFTEIINDEEDHISILKELKEKLRG